METDGVDDDIENSSTKGLSEVYVRIEEDKAPQSTVNKLVRSSGVDEVVETGLL